MNRESKFDHRIEPFNAVSNEHQNSAPRVVVTHIESLLAAAKNTRSDAYEVVTRLSQFVTKLCGSIPPVPCDGINACVAPSGLLAEIQETNDGTQLAIRDIFHMLNVLESAI